MTIKRYDMVGAYDIEMVPMEDGDYVLHSGHMMELKSQELHISSLQIESAILRSTLRETVAQLDAAKEMLAARIVERDELKATQAITAGALTLAELECVRLRSAMSLIAEVIPEYASEAWMVQTAKDALGVTP